MNIIVHVPVKCIFDSDYDFDNPSVDTLELKLYIERTIFKHFEANKLHIVGKMPITLISETPKIEITR